MSRARICTTNCNIRIHNYTLFHLFYFRKQNPLMRKNNDYSRLFKLIGPIAFQYMMSSLVSASDAFMLGFLEQKSLSASSLAAQVAFVFSLFYFGFVMGFNVMGAQYYGKGDLKTVGKVVSITMRCTLISGLIFSLGTLVFPEQVMTFFTSDRELIAEGAKYLRVVSASYFLSGISQVYFGVLKVCDRAGLSSLIGSLAVVLNIILNAVFIFGLGSAPRLGILGAALATVITRLLEAISAFIAMKACKCPNAELKEMLSFKEKNLLREFRKYSFPLLINQLGWGGGVTMYSVIMGHLGSDAVAANSIASIVRSIIASLCWGLASAVGIVIGGMLGCNQLDEAKRLGGKYVRLSIWIGAGSGVVILLLTPIIMNVITLSPIAMKYLKGMMLLASYYIIGNSVNSMVISGVFPAGGDTRFGMFCDLITLWLVIVPAGMIAAFVLKAPVMVVAFVLTLDEFVKMPAVYIHYKKYKWVKNITTNNG